MSAYKKLWEQGFGVISHTNETLSRIESLLDVMQEFNIQGDVGDPYALLWAADRLANAVMWLVVHQTYAKNVYLDGRPLKQEDFKTDPQGHTGGALNMAPGYVGYLLANALTGKTRSWVMEQGHAVSAIDSANILVNNLLPEQAAHYDWSDVGLTRFVQDFYSYALNEQGELAAPMGSHVNPYTAGGVMEGGYLGFTSVQYVHMPLKDERLVAFLSDGAFEEQRGGDFAPRWWRDHDSGLVSPIMIANGRRIDQRSSMSQEGGTEWFVNYLKLHNFDPLVFDGRDPAAFAWAILEMEYRLQKNVAHLKTSDQYNITLPYGIASAPKGAGFYNEGTNHAHNLPLVGNPSHDQNTANRFNVHARDLFVAPEELTPAIALFNHHAQTQRVKERDHALAHRHVTLKTVPSALTKAVNIDRADPKSWTMSSPMEAIDEGFLAIVRANPHLRPRVGNPDEMNSNKMSKTLEALEFRVTDPEGGIKESITGNVITLLNEEAVAGAALGNKGGINIVVTYEAFGVKMLGEFRQDIIFSKHQKRIGRPAGWLSVPLVLTSHTWENGKNEQSHQDPTMCEAMLTETCDISRVFFPPDYNTAAVVMQKVYQTQGQLWTLVVAKRCLPNLLMPEEALELFEQGILELKWSGFQRDEAELALMAVGSYQLLEVLKASVYLKRDGVPHRVYVILEPGRLRNARDEDEAAHVLSSEQLANILPAQCKRIVFVTHTRPEALIGALQPVWRGREVTGLGYINRGGTLDEQGMLKVNRCTVDDILGAVG